jgi:LPS-assembly lipoprotein
MRHPLTLVTAAASLLLVACGFHLRGLGGSAQLPPALASVRVVMTAGGENAPLAVAVRNALIQAGAQIVDSPQAPTVVLSSEQTSSDVVGVRTSTAKASEYRLQYTMTFRVDGATPLAAQTVRLQREYSLDPTRVLAKEQEEQDLLRALRQDAAQQVVRRIARANAPVK